MSDLENNRVVKTFKDLRSRGKTTLVPFITTGYPDLETTEALLRDFESRGVRICELGVPFSDPIADGPVIQTSYTEALVAESISPEEMIQEFFKSQEYLQKRQNPATFLTVAYRAVLRREPDPEGRSTFLPRLEAEGMSREGVLRALLNSQEYLAKKPW